MYTSTIPTLNLENHFLISMPSLQSGIFKHSVVYVCEHSDEGAMGVIINKPIEDLTVPQLLEHLEIRPDNNEDHLLLNKPVMAGGPVAEDQGVILHTTQAGFSMSKVVSNEIMLTTSKDVLSTLGTSKQPKEYLVILGYASWEAKQLETEIAKNAWLTIEAIPTLLFQTPIYERWERAASLIGVDIRQISTEIGHA